MNYEQTIKELAAYVRAELSVINEISSLDFDIDISGRLHDGELKIKFSVGSTYSTGGKVEGGSIDAVLKEYKRRFGWDKRNQPLELSFSPEPVLETIELPVGDHGTVDTSEDISF